MHMRKRYPHLNAFCGFDDCIGGDLLNGLCGDLKALGFALGSTQPTRTPLECKTLRTKGIARLKGFAPAERHVYRNGIRNPLPLQRSGMLLDVTKCHTMSHFVRYGVT